MNNNIIEIPTDEEFNAHHEKCFNELSKEILLKAVEVLTNDFAEGDKKFLVNLYKSTPSETKAQWFIEYHHYDGMAIRNLLRRNGLLDEQLPSGNWDDYYVQVMEVAIGVRESKRVYKECKLEYCCFPECNHICGYIPD